MDGGGCGRGQREQDKRLRSDSQAEELLGNQETNISIFGEEVMRLQSSYFPLFLTNPLLLSQFFKKLRRWTFFKKKGYFRRHELLRWRNKSACS